MNEGHVIDGTFKEKLLKSNKDQGDKTYEDIEKIVRSYILSRKYIYILTCTTQEDLIKGTIEFRVRLSKDYPE
jgi:hypothetical protein